MRQSVKRLRSPDPTIYPEEERVGEDLLHRWIIELLRPLLQWWLTQRGVRALVGADQFIYWRQHDALARVAPDIYVLPGVEPNTRVRSWKIWQDHVVPSFVLEVASQDWEKDYIEAPQRYTELGIPELIIFDPGFDEHAGGLRWQVFRRVARRGLVRVDATLADRVRSKSLGCWLRATGEGRDLRIRIATGVRGDTLVPTADEARDSERLAKDAERVAKEAERAAKEAERAAKEAERAWKEAERAAKEAALMRVAELEATVKRLKRRRKS